MFFKVVRRLGMDRGQQYVAQLSQKFLKLCSKNISGTDWNIEQKVKKHQERINRLGKHLNFVTDGKVY